MNFSYRYGNAMQEVGNKVVSNDEAFMLCEIYENPIFYLKVGNVRRHRYLTIRYLWSVYYIFESSDGENKRTPRGLLKALFYKPEWSYWMLLSAAIT